MNKVLMTSFGALAVAGAVAIPAHSQLQLDGRNALVVHEWGTFTSLEGSDGEIQPGMQHEEEALPGFVHGRDPLHEAHGDPDGPGPVNHTPHCRNFKCFEVDPVRTSGFVVSQKMETPVIYFYAPASQKVKVDVGFPNGIISQYYPAPTLFSPAIGAASSLAGGHVTFDVEIVKSRLPIPSVSAESVYAPSRNVNSDFIRTAAGENEKLVFYRGLGHFYTSLEALSYDGQLTVRNNGGEAISAAFLVDSGEDGGALLELGTIGSYADVRVTAQEIRQLQANHASFSQFTEKAARSLGDALEKSGLYADEARAMVDTWKKSYFRTPGLRVLYLLSRPETEKILPMTVQPAPAELVRTMVGRVEILLDTEEKAIIQDIRAHGEKIRPLGRFAEPKLRRVKNLLRFEADADKLLPVVDHLIDYSASE